MLCSDTPSFAVSFESILNGQKVYCSYCEKYIALLEARFVQNRRTSRGHYYYLGCPYCNEAIELGTLRGKMQRYESEVLDNISLKRSAASLCSMLFYEMLGKVDLSDFRKTMQLQPNRGKY